MGGENFGVLDAFSLLVSSLPEGGWLEREVILNNEKEKSAGGIGADLKKMTEIKIHNSPIRSDEGLTKG